MELAVGEGPEEIGEGVVGNWEAWGELEGWEVEIGEEPGKMEQLGLKVGGSFALI